MDDVDALTRALVGRPTPELASLSDFHRFHAEDTAGVERPVDRAILGGAAADRLAWAFAAGYAAALNALVPALRGVSASLAATEDGGAHPRAIRTRLSSAGDGWRLTGHKRWVTAPGEVLLVLARAGEGETDPLVLVRLERERPGVEMRPLPPLPFVPEIPHAEVRLTDAPVSAADVLPGDGWAAWVKPFRTIEDVHVHAALLGLLASTAARGDWPRPLRARLAAQLVAVRALAALEPASPTVHVALAGALDDVGALVEAAAPHLAAGDETFHARWTRDRPLLGVAGGARAARLERAWEALARLPSGRDG